MLKKPVILLDVDGVLANFSLACLDLIEHETGERFAPEDVVDWNVFEGLGVPHLRKVLEREVSRGGWCAGIKPYPEALKGVERLRRLGEVYVLTSPMIIPNWAYERTLWCRKHFNVASDHVIQTEAKHMVMGDVLVDDKPEHCFGWQAANPQGMAILLDAPYNKEAAGNKAYHWDDVVGMVQSHLLGV